MKYQNIVVYLAIPLALLSIPSLLENVQAQTNSTNQTQAQTNSTNQISQQKNQNMSLMAQALMKVNIFELKDILMNAKLAIVDGNLKEALIDVNVVKGQLQEIEPSPNKLLSNINKTIKAIDKSNIDKSLDTLTGIQVTLLKAENQLFKDVIANRQVMEQYRQLMQQFDAMERQVMQQFDVMEPNTNEEDYTEIEEDYDDTMQQFNNAEPNTNEEDYTEIEDT